MEDNEKILTYNMNFPVVGKTILDILQTGFIISAEDRERTTVDFHLTREEDLDDKPIYSLTNINIDFNGKEDSDDKEWKRTD